MPMHTTTADLADAIHRARWRRRDRRLDVAGEAYYRTTVLTWEEMACADLESMRAIDEVCHEVRSTLAAWSAAVCEANRRLRSEPGVEVDLPEPQTVRIDEARLRIRPT